MRLMEAGTYDMVAKRVPASDFRYDAAHQPVEITGGFLRRNAARRARSCVTPSMEPL